MLRFALLAFSAALCTTNRLRADLEFSGYLTIGKQVHFVVTDLQSHKSSPWLAIGDSFQGMMVTAFDAKNETISLKGPDGPIYLPIKASRVKSSKWAEKIVVRLMVRNGGEVSISAPASASESLDSLLGSLATPDSQVLLRIQGTADIDAKDYSVALRKITDALRTAKMKRIFLLTDRPVEFPFN